MATIVLGQDDVVGHWVGKQIGKLWIHGSGRTLGWVDADGALIAGVTLTNYDGVNVWLDCAATAGKRWADRRALWAVFSYVFEQLGCTRVSSMVPATNYKAHKFNESAGLKHEATLVRAAPGGEDMRVYVLFKEDCKWLKRPQS